MAQSRFFCYQTNTALLSSGHTRSISKQLHPMQRDSHEKADRALTVQAPIFLGLHNEKERQIIRFNALLLVHLQGLEPWAHWLRETNVQQSSIFKIASIRYFYRFIVNLCFASAASLAPVIPSCIRYPAVPVCKKCAKMCRAKISPLKQASDFYAKPGKWPGSNPKR